MEIERLIHITSFILNIPVSSITSKIRQRDLTQAKKIIWTLAKKYLKYSDRLIGEKTGGFDHATVNHGRRKHIIDIENDYDNTIILTAKIEEAFKNYLATYKLKVNYLTYNYSELFK